MGNLHRRLDRLQQACSAAALYLYAAFVDADY
jgi:hypothetical protein